MKEFTLDGIHWSWLRIQSRSPLQYLSIRPPKLLSILSIQSQWTKVRISSKTGYATILVNNTNWISNQLFRCVKTNLEPKGYPRPLLFLPALFQELPAGHMEPHITDWVAKSCHVPKGFELAAYQFECDALTYWAIRNNLGVYYIISTIIF